MSQGRWLHHTVVLSLAMVLLAFIPALSGCSDGGTEAGGSATPEPSTQQSEPEPEPVFRSWQIHINDDDSYQQGGITYSIALNLTAKNPAGEIAGTYSGNATAKTDTSGDVGGAQLNASAIAKSSNLEFTLEDVTAGGDLATLTADTAAYSGKGTITMQAAGSGSVGGASGAFSNNSSQPITVSVTGEKVTLTVPISGHTYTFEGTITGIQ